MQVSHGRRVSKHLFEMDEYEKIIHDFQGKAAKFHRKQYRLAKKSGNETPEQRQARLADKRIEMAHLKNEAMAARSRIRVQVQLKEYRKKEMTLSQMKEEKHHPTDVLEQHLSAMGKPKPSPKHTAHHIVPGTGKTQYAADARIELHLYDIRINDPYNGVWMIRLKAHKKHWSMPAANSHLEIHTHNYEGWVFRRLLAVDDRDEAIRALNLMGKLLQDGNQPPEVTMPPDDSWSGV